MKLKINYRQLLLAIDQTKTVKYPISFKDGSMVAPFKSYIDKKGSVALIQPVPISDLQIGDIFIQGGSPGHAVIVVDMAINSTTGEKAFLLAQSYMPAQETQVLKNPLHLNNPWYYINEINTELVTPEWTFSKNNLKRFK